MNFPAVFGVLRALRNPPLILPHGTISTFDQLPIPVTKALTSYAVPDEKSDKALNIKAIVLDKDNCISLAGRNSVHPDNERKFRELVRHYGPSNVLIVSNSAGLVANDPYLVDAKFLQRNTGVEILKHFREKPACGEEVMKYFEDKVDSPSQIAVIGDRLFSDTIMANQIGAWSIWVKTGVVPDNGWVTKMEYALSNRYWKRGHTALKPL